MRPSIRRRLLTLSAMATLVVVGLASVFVWLMMRHSLRQALDHTLTTEALALANRLEEDGGRIEFEYAPDLNRRTADADPLVLVVADDGHVMYVSPRIAGTAMQTAMQSSGTSARGTGFEVNDTSGHAFRAVALHAAVRHEDEDPSHVNDTGLPHAHAWVFVARPLDPLNESLRQLAGILGLTVALAALLSVGAAMLVARRGSTPIRSVAESLSRIRPERPELNLDRDGVPVELEPVMGTIEGLLDRIGGELARQKQLTADVAHDLRTPLAGVRSLLDVCIQKPRDNAEYVETIGKAQAALRRLSDLLDNVMTLSRLDAAADSAVCSRVSLNEVVAAASSLVQPLADARHVMIRSDLRAADELRTDPPKLSKVLGNILANAVEHSPAGETVLMTARDDERMIEIAIEDHGPGISAELRERIFERFVRLDRARTNDGHHGLGLPIARGLARVLGGDVTLDHSYNRGSRFVIRLPRG